MQGSQKWKHFERLVTAIHRAADEGARVEWDEAINGRQFDVTIRFRKGLYEYLTVIECKDYARPVPVEKVEAFVIKARGANAHHAVMASTSGFQSGAEKVAAQYNMTLIHVTDSSEIDISAFGARWGEPTQVLHIESVELEYGDGEKKRVPTAANAMNYYVGHILIRHESEQGTLADVIQHHSAGFPRNETNEYLDHVIPCPPGTQVIGPDDGEIPLKPLSKIHVRAGLSEAKTLTGPVMFEPYLLVPDVKVRNVATGQEHIFNQDGLQLGINTAFEEGQFYEQPRMAAFYYCHEIKDGIATIFMVESFQLGQLIQADFTVHTKYASYYVPVADEADLKRLRRRLDQLRAKQTAKRNRG